MADVDITVNDKFTYEFTCYDKDTGDVLDISGFTTRQLDIRPTNYTDSLLLDSKTLTFTTDGTDGKLDWAIDPADFTSQPPGPAYGQIHLATASLTRKSFQFDIMMHRDIS
jgi:hypothetical protein